MSTAAVILAAGEGSRFRSDSPSTTSRGTALPPDQWGHKLRAEIGGVAVVRLAVDAALGALGHGINEVVVVTGAAEFEDLLPLEQITLLTNANWHQGMATSLAVAIDHGRSAGHGAVVVGLGDQPGLLPEAWRAVAAHDASPIGVATYAGRRRNPVRLAAETWDLLPTTGDEGARSLIRLHPEMVTEIPCPGNPGDIDTREDLASWS